MPAFFLVAGFVVSFRILAPHYYLDPDDSQPMWYPGGSLWLPFYAVFGHFEPIELTTSPEAVPHAANALLLMRFNCPYSADAMVCGR